MNMSKPFKRQAFHELMARFREPRRFIQVLAGPRQTGKTTLARQLVEGAGIPCHYATADEPTLKDHVWLDQQWETGRRLVGPDRPAVLILDEIQKIPNWPETVKHLWDEDTHLGRNLHVVALGSSPLLIQHGLTESLAGRFEVIRITHWSFAEMRKAFGWDLSRFIYHGGYPGSAALIDDPPRWKRYILDSLVETSVSRDILLMNRVDKPALLRRLFELGCAYSGQVLSYQKMLGQLQDVGNTTTLAHYLALLKGAGLVIGLQKYAGEAVRRRGSSPKLLVCNTALMSVFLGCDFHQAQRDAESWGRLVESAIGSSLVNGAGGGDIEVYYWSSGSREVDFVLRRGKKLSAIEVKSGALRARRTGLETFANAFGPVRQLLVGTGGIPLEDFLSAPVGTWVE